VLAVDTATQTAGVALVRGGVLIAECVWRSEENHTTELALAVVRLLQSQRVLPSEVQALAVTVGPGTFNGLRVGLSLAKGMAQALTAPLVGVSTLEVMAYQHAACRCAIRPIIAAGQGQLATALFRTLRGRWRRLEPDRLATLQEIMDITRHRTVLCGELGPDQRLSIAATLGKTAVVPSSAASMRRAGALAELAWLHLQHASGCSPDEVTPVYLRRPSIGTVAGAAGTGTGTGASAGTSTGASAGTSGRAQVRL
jgi:tRNA threonylcarbamoyladenosine biosynthesis protein TsaB